jgi:serine/threonine protein kinase
MASPISDSELLGRLAAEWRQRLRRGERPELSEYTARYPELAEQIRELLPGLIALEELRPATANLTGDYAPAPDQAGPPERLGDFRILREVGRGGMGIVYEAEQESLGRRVALKVLPASALLDERLRQRFQREARAAAKLHHTNIVPVFGVGEESGLLYYVMQFIPGQGLDRVLKELRRQRRDGPATPEPATAPQVPAAAEEFSAADVARSLLTGSPGVGQPPVVARSGDRATRPDRRSPVPAERRGDLRSPSVARSGDRATTGESPSTDGSEIRPTGSASLSLSGSGRPYWKAVARIGAQVAEALDYAAGQGILHRDIKPANLLLDLQANVWVTDFGLAKAMTDEEGLTHTGDIVGTLRYMAPERFQGKSDIRCDVYSLGLTLYELLVQRPAFTENDRSKLIHQLTHEEPAPPRKLEPAIPRDLETVVLKAIARDPAHRYQTAGELAADLKRFGEDRPVQARRVTAAERLWRWCKRNPALATSTAGVVVLLLAGTGISTYFGIQAERKAAQAVAAEQRTAESAAEAEANLYVARMNLAQIDWDNANLGRLLELLEPYRHPPTGKRDLRGWEWYFQDRLCHADLRTLKGHTSWVRSVAFSPDGSWLASGSHDGTIKIWDTASGRELRSLKGHIDEVYCVAVSPDGSRLASGSEDKTIKVWDAASGQELCTCKGHTSFVLSVAFSPDGSRLASASWDKTVKVWDTANGQELRTLRGHSDRVSSVAFSPDGSRVASGGDDWTIKVWDTASGQELRTLKGHTHMIWSVAFSSDGSRLASGSWDTTIKLWDARPLTSELGRQREALGLLEYLCPKSPSKEKVIERLGAHKGITPEVRNEALALLGDYWPRHIRAEASAFVTSLFAKELLRAEVREKIKADGTLRDVVRQQALILVEQGPENAPALNSRSRPIVRRPDAKAQEYQAALRQAEAACRVEPENWFYLNTLGVAQYRTGKYAETVATLTRSEKLHQERYSGFSPADLAFLALAHDKLGHKAEAQAYRQRLREAVKQPRWATDAEVQGFLREVEAHFGSEKPKAKP